MAPDNTNPAGAISAPFARAWLAALVAIFVFICLHGMDGYYYSPDEMLHIDTARGETLAQALSFSLHETDPPLGTALRHYWMMISDSVFFARAMSLLFGVALILLYYRIGEKLSGTLAGMCCAALVAFSHGCIVQSFLVRNYTLFLFLISLCFYSYLHWHERRGRGALLGYVLFGALACAAHFFSVAAIFCIAGCEWLYLCVRRAPVSTHIQWIAANFWVAAAAGGEAFFWLPAAPPVHAFFAYQTASMHGHFLGLFFPLAVYAYLLPCWTMPSLPVLALLSFLVYWAARRDRAMRPLLILLCSALALGMALVACTGPYPFLVGRHDLWMMPFVLPVAGWTLAYFCARCVAKGASRHLVACLLLAAGVMSYRPAIRFADANGEYSMPQAQWEQLTHYLATLDDHSLMVAGKTDAVGLDPEFNPYRAIDEGGFSGDFLPRVIPYFHTHMLFDQYDVRIYSGAVMRRLMQQAAMRNLVAADRLVFLNTDWVSDPLARLMLCPALDKEIIAFPALPPGHSITRADIFSHPATLLIVSKDNFFRQVMSPGGKAHGCLADER